MILLIEFSLNLIRVRAHFGLLGVNPVLNVAIPLGGCR
jgi:hypothetical protein